jgi:hypothetical protein
MSSALEKRYKELLAEAKRLEREYPASATDIYLDCATIVDALADATSDAFLQSEGLSNNYQTTNRYYAPCTYKKQFFFSPPQHVIAISSTNCENTS